MKLIFIVVSIFISTLSYAQDCENLFDKEVDKFSKEVGFSSKGLNNLGFVKSITGKSTVYYLALRTTGHTVNVNQKGVTILLGDGTKIIRSQAVIDVEPDVNHHFGPGDFEYSAFISVTLAEMNRIKKAGITDFKLYIYQQELNEEQVEAGKLKSGCLITLK